MTTGTASSSPKNRLRHSSVSQLAAKRRLLPRDLGALRGEILIVELLDLLRRSPAPRGAAASTSRRRNAGAVVDFLDDRPVEQRLEALPVVVEVGFETPDARFVLAAPLRAMSQQLAPAWRGCVSRNCGQLRCDTPARVRARCRAGSRARRCRTGARRRAARAAWFRPRDDAC